MGYSLRQRQFRRVRSVSEGRSENKSQYPRDGTRKLLQQIIATPKGDYSLWETSGRLSYIGKALREADEEDLRCAACGRPATVLHDHMGWTYPACDDCHQTGEGFPS